VTNELSSLESEMDEIRERLAGNIDQLVYRANPKTIVNREIDQVKGFFIDAETGEPRQDNILKVVGGVVGFITLMVIIRKSVG
jgi:Protein of unknown function (DUF3618)